MQKLVTFIYDVFPWSVNGIEMINIVKNEPIVMRLMDRMIVTSLYVSHNNFPLQLIWFSYVEVLIHFTNIVLYIYMYILDMDLLKECIFGKLSMPKVN